MSSKPDQQRPRFFESWLLRILLTIFSAVVALFAIRPMVSYRALELQATPAEIGFIAGAYGLFALTLAVPIGKLGDRIGEVPLMLGGTIGSTSVAVSLVYIDSLWMLGLSQAVIGLTHMTTLIGVQSLVANAGRPQGRDARYGAVTSLQAVGQMVGPLVAGLLMAGSALVTASVWWFAAAASMTATLAAVTLLIRPAKNNERTRATQGGQADPSAQQAEGDREASGPADGGRGPANAANVSKATNAPNARPKQVGLREILSIKGMPQAMLISLTVLTSIDVLVAYLPVYGEANNIPVTVITSLLAVRAAMGILSRAAMVPMTRFFGRKRLLLSTAWIPAITLIGLPLTDSEAVLYVIVGICGFFLGLGQPMTIAWVAGQAPPNARSTALGIRLSGNKLGQMALPVVVGAVASTVGLASAFWFTGGILAVSALAVRTAALDDPPGTPARVDRLQ